MDTLYTYIVFFMTCEFTIELILDYMHIFYRQTDKKSGPSVSNHLRQNSNTR